MEILFSDPVTLAADVISGISDIAAFTVAVFLLSHLCFLSALDLALIVCAATDLLRPHP